MPTRLGQTTITVEGPIAQRLRALKRGLPYDQFISQVLDAYENFEAVDPDVFAEMIKEYQTKNPEAGGKLNHFLLGMRGLGALMKRQIKNDVAKTVREHPIKRRRKASLKEEG